MNTNNTTGNYIVLWKALRFKLYHQCKGRCEWCHCKLDGRFELHHINGNGLDNKDNNLVVLCTQCHGMTKPHSLKPQLDLPLVGQWESIKGTGERLPMSIIREQYKNCFPRA